MFNGILNPIVLHNLYDCIAEEKMELCAHVCCSFAEWFFFSFSVYFMGARLRDYIGWQYSLLYAVASRISNNHMGFWLCYNVLRWLLSHRCMGFFFLLQIHFCFGTHFCLDGIGIKSWYNIQKNATAATVVVVVVVVVGVAAIRPKYAFRGNPNGVRAVQYMHEDGNHMFLMFMYLLECIEGNIWWKVTFGKLFTYIILYMALKV